MTIAKDILQADIAYSAWANRRVLEACAALTAAELTHDLGQSHRSVLLTLNHMYEGEQFWSHCLLTNRMPPMDEIRDSGVPAQPRLEELERAWPQVWTNLDAWLTALPEEDLAQTLTCRLRGGHDFHFARWQLLRHVVNHSTLHRGQIVGMLRMLDKHPCNVDLLSYYLSARRKQQ
ncbi:MAG: DinB family protein [Bryobacteraceae bacterium]